MTRHGDNVATTFVEFEILTALARSPGRVFTRDMLLSRVWGDSAYRDPRTIDVHIRHLREKIETDPKEPEYLFTVRGVGYRFRDDEDYRGCPTGHRSTRNGRSAPRYARPAVAAQPAGGRVRAHRVRRRRHDLPDRDAAAGGAPPGAEARPAAGRRAEQRRRPDRLRQAVRPQDERRPARYARGRRGGRVERRGADPRGAAEPAGGGAQDRLGARRRRHGHGCDRAGERGGRRPAPGRRRR